MSNTFSARLYSFMVSSTDLYISEIRWVFTSVLSTMAAINSGVRGTYCTVQTEYLAEGEESPGTWYFVRSLTFKARLCTRSCNVKAEQKNQSSTTKKCMKLLSASQCHHNISLVTGCSTGVRNLTGSACTSCRCLQQHQNKLKLEYRNFHVIISSSCVCVATDSELQAIKAPPLISTIHKSP
jgi:hypothetical protein